MPFDAAIAPTPSVFVPGRTPASTPRDGSDQGFAKLLQRNLSNQQDQEASSASDGSRSDTAARALSSKPNASASTGSASSTAVLPSADAASTNSAKNDDPSAAASDSASQDWSLKQTEEDRATEASDGPNAATDPSWNAAGVDFHHVVASKPIDQSTAGWSGATDAAAQIGQQGIALGESDVGAAGAAKLSDGELGQAGSMVVKGPAFSAAGANLAGQSAAGLAQTTTAGVWPRKLSSGISALDALSMGSSPGAMASLGNRGVAPPAENAALSASGNAADARTEILLAAGSASTVGISSALTAASPASTFAGWLENSDQLTAVEARPRDQRDQTTDAFAGLASAFNTAAPTQQSATTAPASVHGLQTPVQSPEFAQALGQQISVLVSKGIQQASLQLNPAELGPVSVRITLDGQQAQVHFGADSAVTRSVLESSLPQLASAMSDAGFTLTGGGVSQHSGNGADPSSNGSSRAPLGAEGAGARTVSGLGTADDSQSTRVLRSRVRLGGVDTYA